MIVQPMNTANKTGKFAEAGPLNWWLRIDMHVTPPQEDGKPKSLAKIEINTHLDMITFLYIWELSHRYWVTAVEGILNSG